MKPKLIFSNEVFDIKNDKDLFKTYVEPNKQSLFNMSISMLVLVFLKSQLIPKNNLDLTLIYNFVFYSLADNIMKLDLFDNFTNISKPNIQFVYWWRNKLANMVFLRYMRIKNNKTNQNENYYPNFSSFADNQELINFFYTYIPNSSISMNEIKNDIYNLFHNNSSQ